MSTSALPVPRQEMLQRIEGEYLEMPGLRLTCDQAQRLWGLDRITCCDLLAELVSASFLTRTIDGHYARASEGAFPRPRMARASLDITPFEVRRIASR
jgi:hypothetical protein